MKKKVGFIILLLAQAAMISSRNPVVVCSSKPVVAAVSGSVTLQCFLDPPLDATNMTVEWSHEHLNHTVHLHRASEDNHTQQGEHFKGRMSLFHDGLTKGNLSLKLSPVRLYDSGTYRCSFSTDTLNNSCYVNLTVVLEGKGDSAELMNDSSHGIDRRIIIGIVVSLVIMMGIAVLCGCRCEAIMSLLKSGSNIYFGDDEAKKSLII